MEMESDHMDSEEVSSDSDNSFREPKANPRIGDEFQAQIPPIMKKSEYLRLLTNADVLMGVPVPITWLNEKSKKGQADAKGKNLELDDSDMNATLNDFKASRKENRKCKNTSRGLAFPGSVGGAWSDSEKDAFLLCLYIFRKNFSQVKKLMGNRGMPDILAYYYGEFYRSAKYRRWLDCRRLRRRKCVYGRKIFIGWRQQELLSRLISLVPEESQSTLLEVSKSFAEAKTSLENYVLYLKATVGINALVKAVGIGKGKEEDLTTIGMEPVRTTNRVFNVGPAIMPKGKNCSSLTSDDIITFLSGDFQLSKARRNDIFWEAVWPRLLARGWHSEESKKFQNYVGLKNQLVFLLPGVKKFSRRKLVKGDHYFDSISDILNKVVSEPKLLEFQDGEDGASFGNQDDDSILEESSDDHDDLSNHKSRCYLKPRVSNQNSGGHPKFLIVDTSLVPNGKASEIMEMKYLPYDFKYSMKSARPSREKAVSREKRNKCDSNDLGDMKFVIVDTSLVHGGKKPSEARKLRGPPLDYLSNEDEQNGVDRKTSKSDFDRRAKSRNSSSHLVPHVKRRRLTACAKTKTTGYIKNFLVNMGSTNVKPCCKPHTHGSKDVPQTGISPETISSVNSLVKEESHCSKSSGFRSKMEISDLKIANHQPPPSDYPYLSENFPGYVNSVDPLGSKESALDSSNVSQTGASLDNIPWVSNEGISGDWSSKIWISDENLEKSQPPPTEDRHLTSQSFPGSQDCQESTAKKNLKGMEASTELNSEVQQQNEIPRRHSTRKRPLTAKALEALECGYLDIEPALKSKVKRRETLVSNPLRKARSKVKPLPQVHGNITCSEDPKGENEAKEGNIGNADMVSETCNHIVGEKVI